MSERDLKAEYEVLMAMTPEERKVHFLTEAVESENYWLENMLIDWRDDRSYSMAEIREQRKRVQVWTKRLNAARQMQSESERNAKRNQSSDNSTA